MTTAYDNPANLRVAVIALEGVPCGIATYSAWLIEEMRKHVKDLHLFAESNGNSDTPQITHCWQRGRPMNDLIGAIKRYNPDVIYIQHEYGLFPHARHWLALLSGLHGYRTIVTLHSVYPAHADKTVCEAACNEIIVHTKQAAKVLTDVKKVSGKVNVVPHGCFPFDGRPKLWNIYGTERSLIQFGFGFKYKGWERSLEAVARLKMEFPDVFFTGIVSESKQHKDAHRAYFDELQKLVIKLGIIENVALIPGFQTDEALDSFLRTNRVAIFPYIPNGEHTVYAASGAALLAMAKGVPTVVSNVPLFDQLDGVCPRIDNIDDLVSSIRTLFNANEATKQVERQNEYLRANAWPATAAKYLEVLR